MVGWLGRQYLVQVEEEHPKLVTERKMKEL